MKRNSTLAILFAIFSSLFVNACGVQEDALTKSEVGDQVKISCLTAQTDLEILYTVNSVRKVSPVRVQRSCLDLYRDLEIACLKDGLGFTVKLASKSGEILATLGTFQELGQCANVSLKLRKKLIEVN